MELHELNKIDLSARRPPEDMTDEQWQKYFLEMKKMIKPSKERRMNPGASLTIKGYRLESQSTYDGETQWQRYCQFINSILSAIRSGEYDYCFNIYQITDLLKYEHSRLRTTWQKDNQCFLVWLAR